MPFWRRKKDQFVSLGLNRDVSEQPVVEVPKPADAAQSALATEPEKLEPAAPAASAPWQTSVLGLDLSIEQLQAREAALEQEFSARFRRAVAATRESLSDKIDNVFAGTKQIDATHCRSC